MDTSEYLKRLEKVYETKDVTGLEQLVEELTAEVKSESAAVRESLAQIVEGKMRGTIDARLVSIGLAEFADEIVVLGPTGFELVVHGDWTPTLGELVILGRAFDTAAIQIGFDLNGTRKRQCDCGDPDCSTTDTEVPRLVIAVDGARI